MDGDWFFCPSLQSCVYTCDGGFCSDKEECLEAASRTPRTGYGGLCVGAKQGECFAPNCLWVNVTLGDDDDDAADGGGDDDNSRNRRSLSARSGAALRRFWELSND